MESKTFAVCTVRDCVAKAGTGELRADVDSKKMFPSFFLSESGRVSMKL